MYIIKIYSYIFHFTYTQFTIIAPSLSKVSANDLLAAVVFNKYSFSLIVII